VGGWGGRRDGSSALPDACWRRQETKLWGKVDLTPKVPKWKPGASGIVPAGSAKGLPIDYRSMFTSDMFAIMSDTCCRTIFFPPGHGVRLPMDFELDGPFAKRIRNFVANRNSFLFNGADRCAPYLLPSASVCRPSPPFSYSSLPAVFLLHRVLSCSSRRLGPCKVLEFGRVGVVAGKDLVERGPRQMNLKKQYRGVVVPNGQRCQKRARERTFMKKRLRAKEEPAERQITRSTAEKM